MSRFIVTADWDTNAPHLTPTARRELWDSIPPYQKDARTKGIPQLGAGVIYPIPDDEILCDPFAIPDDWPRGFGLDVGWHRTAAIWDAMDPETKVVYRYDEYYRGEADPEVHAAAIRRRGLWIPGRIDPASRGRAQADGIKLLHLYRKSIYGDEDIALGVRQLGIANNAVESGIYMEWMALSQGFLKIMRGRCPNWMAERRLYRRDEKGRVIKKNDHALDAGRYRTASGNGWLVAKPKPVAEDTTTQRFASGGRDTAGDNWMAR